MAVPTPIVQPEISINTKFTFGTDIMPSENSASNSESRKMFAIITYPQILMTYATISVFLYPNDSLNPPLTIGMRHCKSAHTP